VSCVFILLTNTIFHLFRFLRGKPEEVQIQLDNIAEEDGMPEQGIAGIQLYEEIRESETETAAGPSGVSAPATVPQYDDVMPAGKVSKSSDSYHITQCSAYGVALN
jgi:hypothetical protein